MKKNALHVSKASPSNALIAAVKQAVKLKVNVILIFIPLKCVQHNITH